MFLKLASFGNVINIDNFTADEVYNALVLALYDGNLKSHPLPDEMKYKMICFATIYNFYNLEVSWLKIVL